MMTYMKQFMSSGRGITHHIEWHSLFRLCEIFIYLPSVVCFVLAKRERGRGITNVRVCQDRIIKFVWDRLAHLCRTHLSSYVLYTLCYIDKSFLLPNPLLPSFLLLLLLRCCHLELKHLHPSICIFSELFLSHFIPPSTSVLSDTFPSLLFWPWPQFFSSAFYLYCLYLDLTLRSCSHTLVSYLLI